jgi:hypothetical protein
MRMRVLRCLLLLVLALGMAAGPAVAQKGKPLSVKDIKELLQGGVPPSRIAAIVAEEGIDFTLFDELEDTFRKAGANDELIDALRKASKSEQPEQPAAPRGGILKVQSKPGEAQVYLNDEMKGTTTAAGDFRLPGLAAGTYRLRVSLAGYKSFERTLKITAGETEDVFVTLEQQAVRPTVTLESNLATIQAGQYATLSWTSQDAADVDIEPGVGKVATSGTTNVYPRETTTYTLTAIGPGGVNTATAQVNVTAPPPPPTPRPVPQVVGGIPNFPIPGATVEVLKFFESGYGAPKLGSRIYLTRFSHRTARFINWEITFRCPATTSRIDFTINAIWYNPNGTVMANQNMNTYAEAGWTEPVFNFGRGWAKPGNWKRGNYRVDLSVNGNRIASGVYQID